MRFNEHPIPPLLYQLATTASREQQAQHNFQQQGKFPTPEELTDMFNLYHQQLTLMATQEVSDLTTVVGGLQENIYQTPAVQTISHHINGEAHIKLTIISTELIPIEKPQS